MGITIHYSGKLKETANLSNLIEEARDIAEIYQWKYTQFPIANPDDSKKQDPVTGICFSPLNCEPVWLCFLPDGNLCNPVLLSMTDVSGALENKSDFPPEVIGCFTKTQYAGEDIHKLIVHLLKYLSAKYFESFEVFDEGYFWETGDEELLKKTFELYRQHLDSLAEAISHIPKSSEENFEAYFQKLMKHIRKNKGI